MTDLINIKNLILQCREEYGLVNFIETGCYKGDGIQTALDLGFEKIVSCDINPEYSKECAFRFFDDLDRIYLYTCQSQDIFKRINQNRLGQFWEEFHSEPALIWSDAHLPRMYGYNMEDEVMHSPMPEELEAFKTFAPYRNSVFILDDLRIIKDDDNPAYEIHKGKIPGDQYTNRFTLQNLKDILCKTHKAEIFTDYEGFMVFSP